MVKDGYIMKWSVSKFLPCLGPLSYEGIDQSSGHDGMKLKQSSVTTITTTTKNQLGKSY